MKTLAALWLMFGCLSLAHAAPLAVICIDGQAGQPASVCKALKYDLPAPTDLVRKGTSWMDFVLQPFSALLPTDKLDTCTTPLAAPTVSPIPFTAADPCKAFAVVAASSFGALPSIELHWSGPSKNVDGSPLTDLAGFRLVYGSAANALTQTVEIKDPAATAYTLAGLAYATTYYVAIKAFTSAGIESDKSNTVSKTTPSKPSEPTTPLPPVLTVTDLTAYDLVKANDKLSLAIVGTVPAATKCISAIAAMGLFGVPRATVKLATGKARPQVVLAKCA